MNEFDETTNRIIMSGLVKSSVVKRILSDEWNRFADVGKIMSDGMKSILEYSPEVTIHDFAKKVKDGLTIHFSYIDDEGVGPIRYSEKPKLNHIFKKIDDWANSREPNVASLYECMLIDDEKKPMLLDILRKLINGKKGKDVALVILVCVKYHLMTRPPHKILASVFGEIGSPQGYNDYYNRGLDYFRPDEINRIEKLLSNILIVDN